MNPFIVADSMKCIGCRTCEVACVVAHQAQQACASVSRDAFLPRIRVLKGDTFSTAVTCHHCEDAPCVSVCPTGASFRDENGIVQVDKSRCIGCDYCVAACPFHVRYLNPQTGIADKCNFCADTRLESGQSPACVSVCPTDALKFGRRDDPEIQHWINQKEVYRQQDTRSGPVSVYRRKEIHQEGKA